MRLFRHRPNRDLRPLAETRLTYQGENPLVTELTSDSPSLSSPSSPTSSSLPTSSRIDWASRVVRLAKMCPDELTPNPLNWRDHPKAQVDAMVAALQEIGSTSPVVYNLDTGHLIDGHLRVAIAVNYRIPLIDVLQVSLPEYLEAEAVQTHDLITALADADSDKLIALAKQLSWQTDELALLFAPMLERAMAEIDRGMMEPLIPAGTKQTKKMVYEQATDVLDGDVVAPDPEISTITLPLTNAQRERLYAAIDWVRQRNPEGPDAHISTSKAVVLLCQGYLRKRGVRIAQ